MNNPKVLRYELTYLRMGKSLQEEKPDVYYFHLFRVILREAAKGFRPRKINPPTQKGTRINYIVLKTPEDVAAFNIELRDMAAEYNEKYNAGIGIGDDTAV